MIKNIALNFLDIQSGGMLKTKQRHEDKMVLIANMDHLGVRTTSSRGDHTTQVAHVVLNISSSNPIFTFRDDDREEVPLSTIQ